MTEFLSAFVSELLRKCYEAALKEKKLLMCSISLKLDAVQFRAGCAGRSKKEIKEKKRKINQKGKL